MNFVRENGDIEAEDLINEMPFKQIEYMDYFEDTNVVYRLIYRLHKAIEGRNVVVYKQAYYPVSMVAEGS